jgi:hypothetical protein
MYDNLRERGFESDFVHFLEETYNGDYLPESLLNKMHLAYLAGQNSGLFLGLKIGREEGYENGVQMAKLGIE